MTPVQLSMFDQLDTPWIVTNYVVDFLFFIDIFIIFNTAVYDDDFQIILDRAVISKQYFFGWFVLDVIAILPFELMVNNGSSAGLVRLARIGRINKIFKLMKLIRLMRLSQSSSLNALTSLQEFLKIPNGFRWFFLFFCYFTMSTHIISCMWILTGYYDLDENSWITQVSDASKSELYLTSFYYTITTVTTVGYGDWSANTFSEKIVAIFIMFTGVIAFSFASGSLTSYIQ